MGEFNQQEQLLKSMLPMAVTMNIMDFKRLPWSQLQEIATYASQYVAEKGDNILFKGPKKGDTAKAFNELAKGIAVASFAPGGVKFLGMHFEATHPESLDTGAGRWLYHSTWAVDLPNIAKHGLTPEADNGKLYLTAVLKQVVRHIQSGISQFVSAGDPILLRVHSAHIGDIEQENSLSDDWYIQRPIPAIFVQIWVPQKQAWIEVREALEQDYFATDRRTYGKTAADLLKYIQESWPTV